MILDELKQYYADLLIIQYQRPKARAEIELYVNTLIPVNSLTGNLLLDDIQNGFDLDSAVGVQLDTIGKYIGLERFFVDIDYEPGIYFAFTDYQEPVSEIPDDSEGFSNYLDYDDNNGDVLTYDDISTTGASLLDSDYRLLLKLKAVLNSSNGSRKEINDSLFGFFGADVFVDSAGVMALVYFYESYLSDIMTYAIQKGILPKPAGVRLNGIIELPLGGFFSMIDYTTPTEAFDDYTGFSDYTDFDTIEGEVLTYESLET